MPGFGFCPSEHTAPCQAWSCDCLTNTCVSWGDSLKFRLPFISTQLAEPAVNSLSFTFQSMLQATKQPQGILTALRFSVWVIESHEDYADPQGSSSITTGPDQNPFHDLGLCVVCSATLKGWEYEILLRVLSSFKWNNYFSSQSHQILRRIFYLN